MKKHTQMMAALAAIGMMGTGRPFLGPDTMPEPPKPREPDLERILAAEAKRERKRLAKEEQRLRSKNK